MRTKRFGWIGALAIVGALMVNTLGQTQTPSAADDVAKQRQMLLETSGILPGDLYVEIGKEMFLQERGPQGKTLAECEWGGEGEYGVDGAYAKMPTYFPDTQRVEDLDNRVRTCMMQAWGLSADEIDRTELVQIAFFVASRSSGHETQVSLDHSAEQAMYEAGEALWNHRAGSLDMSCAVCHDVNSRKRIRLQTLAAVTDDAVASHWPAYRFGSDRWWTMEDRIQACYRQVDVDDPDLYSDALVALQLYMSYKANGAPIEAPGFVR